jgi:hypothetical protein
MHHSTLTPHLKTSQEKSLLKWDGNSIRQFVCPCRTMPEFPLKISPKTAGGPATRAAGKTIGPDYP